MSLFNKSSKADKYIPKETQKQLKQLFQNVPKNIPVFLFTNDDMDQKALEVARGLFKALQELSDKIEFEELNLTDPRAGEWGVDRAPVLVFAPDRYNIKYLGLPLGEEGRTLIETLILVGLGASRLNDQAKDTLDRIDSERQVKVFVTGSCPYCPQQAVNAVKAAIHRPPLVSVEIVDTDFNRDLGEKYSAFSVPQTFANEILIGKGAQPEELFAASLESLEEQRVFIPSSKAELVEADLVIIGGGPAGLTAGIYAARSGLDTVLVEKDTLGGQIATTPVVDNYPGLAHVGGKNLVEIMVAHALEYITVFPKESVIEIKPGDPVEITTSLRTFKARAVLLATGATHRKLGLPGEIQFAGRGVSYCSTCDGPLFSGKKVLMVGGGNSAVTEALHLDHIGADVTLVHRRDELRAQERLVHELEHHQIPILWDTEIQEINGRKKVEEVVLYNNKTHKSHTLAVDGVFVSIGYIPEVELGRKLGLELTEEGYIKHDGNHRTNLRGIYSAGDVEGGFKQIVTAAGAGAAAAMIIFEDLTHPYWKGEEDVEHLEKASR